MLRNFSSVKITSGTRESNCLLLTQGNPRIMNDTTKKFRYSENPKGEVGTIILEYCITKMNHISYTRSLQSIHQ